MIWPWNGKVRTSFPFDPFWHLEKRLSQNFSPSWFLFRHTFSFVPVNYMQLLSIRKWPLMCMRVSRKGGKLTRAGHTWLSPGMAKSDQHSITCLSLMMGKRNPSSAQNWNFAEVVESSDLLQSCLPKKAPLINNWEDILQRSVVMRKSSPLAWLRNCLSLFSVVCLSIVNSLQHNLLSSEF